MKQRIPRRLRRLRKKKGAVKWCLWCGTAWPAPREFCDDYCRARYEDM